MRNSISKTMLAGVGALAMAAAVILPTTPASAGWNGNWHGGGWGGGWHGGGWHGGWGGGSWHPGYWRGGVWYNGWWGPAVAAGVVAGALAAGALATYPGYGYGYGYPNNGCWASRPTYDAYGRYLGSQWVSVC
jgi:hypothetical protein